MLKKLNDFDDDIELFKRIKSVEKKIEDAKELQNIFKSNLNEISKERFKSEEQIIALENIKLLYKSRQAVIKSLNEYCLIASEAKHKVKFGKGLKILSPK